MKYNRTISFSEKYDLNDVISKLNILVTALLDIEEIDIFLKRLVKPGLIVGVECVEGKKQTQYRIWRSEICNEDADLVIKSCDIRNFHSIFVNGKEIKQYNKK